MKQKVALEAALLLYSSQECEYKQAKLRASKTLRTWVLPTNIQVAKALDELAEGIEGSNRRERILRMRHEALNIMKILQDFHPKLIGSLWRGTANKNSDIDITAFSSDPASVQLRLQNGFFRLVKAEWQCAPKLDRGDKSFHIYGALESGDDVEVVVRDPERVNKMEKCEIYGDMVTGLSISQLERVLNEDPLRKFVP